MSHSALSFAAATSFPDCRSKLGRVPGVPVLWCILVTHLLLFCTPWEQPQDRLRRNAASVGAPGSGRYGIRNNPAPPGDCAAADPGNTVTNRYLIKDKS